MPLINAEDLQASSLLQIDPVSPAQVTPSPSTSTRADFAAVYVDLSWVPNLALLSHVEGSPWVVNNYYSQQLTKDSELSGVQLSLSRVYQSYTCISGLELRVTSPLTQTQDDTTKAILVSGAAAVYGPVIPNEGDHFTADLGQGQIGVFRVTGSVKRSPYKETVWTIEYDLDTTAEDKRLELEARTAVTYYWNKSYLLHGKNPLVTTQEWEACKDISGLYQATLRTYLDLVYSREYNIIALPGQGDNVVYDHQLSLFVRALLSGDGDPRLTYMIRYSANNDLSLIHI